VKIKNASLGCLLAGLYLIFSCVNSVAQELSATENAEVQKLLQSFATGKYATTSTNAWLLYRSGEEANYRIADTILEQFMALQDTVRESLTFGQWAWSAGAPIGDLNVALFRCHDMFANLWDQQSKMAPQTRDTYLASCRRLVEAARRRWDTEIFDIGRDFVNYSNIFVLYIQTLTLAGDRFNEPRLQQMAKSQWTRWYNHVTYIGIDEFASPTYNQVVFRALFDIHDFCHDERIQKETREMIDHVYTLQSALTHPKLKIPVSGISRDYRVFLKEADARSGVLTIPQAGYQPPAKAIAINEHRKYPFTVIGRAAISPFIFQSYQLEDAAMGSMTGGACFQQQIHCLAVAGKSESERAVVFIQGSNTPMNGYTDQKEMSTLCVYNRLPALWHLTQWRGDMTEYRGTFGEFGIGLSDKWQKTTVKDHIVLQAFGYDVHLFPFAVQNGKAVAIDLELKHRTSSSPRYHPRPIVFDEYVFPEKPDWFGVYVTLVKSGDKVDNPRIVYAKVDGIDTFKTRRGHLIRLYTTPQGDTRQLYNVDPALIPLLKFSE
jgi:hypothetical protein